MSGLVRLARFIPALRRLHDDRNHRIEAHQELAATIERLSQERAVLEERLSSATEQLMTLACRPHPSEPSHALQAQVEHLKQLGDYIEKAQVEGRMPEFDYPYAPRVRDWDKVSGGNIYRAMLACDDQRYHERLQTFLQFSDKFATIPLTEPLAEDEPYWNNGWFAAADAISLYGMIATLNPRRYVEVGSGNSTKFVRRAIRDNRLRTHVTSIDPMPRAVIDRICDQVVRQPLEDVRLELFDDLGSEDVIFIDSSHRSFQNSDVTIFFTEILPTLKSGCYYGIHDIFLPFDYPRGWEARYYNEQYLLMCYLLGGAGRDKIILPIHHVLQDSRALSILDPILCHPKLRGAHQGGGAFWLRRC